LQGIKTAADEALASVKPGEEILGMGITRKKDPRINLFWKRWHVRRLERKIRALHLFSETSEYFTHFKKMKYTEARILTGITPVTVDIFGNDKVLILNYAEPTSCILIHDENTATSFRNFFYQLWKTSKDK
jgi:sugar-specific transcriptional regulator TrmB